MTAYNIRLQYLYRQGYSQQGGYRAIRYGNSPITKISNIRSAFRKNT